MERYFTVTFVPLEIWSGKPISRLWQLRNKQHTVFYMLHESENVFPLGQKVIGNLDVCHFMSFVIWNIAIIEQRSLNICFAVKLNYEIAVKGIIYRKYKELYTVFFLSFFFLTIYNFYCIERNIILFHISVNFHVLFNYL